jgi:hypothetical protein
VNVFASGGDIAAIEVNLQLPAQSSRLTRTNPNQPSRLHAEFDVNVVDRDGERRFRRIRRRGSTRYG